VAFEQICKGTAREMAGRGGQRENSEVSAPGEEAAGRRRAVEALAQALYEASDPAGVPWVRRRPIIREPWLVLAAQQIKTSEQAGDGAAESRPGPSGRTEGCD
jgi:hypothetical protein